jgi:hypothetical protein
MKIKFIVLGLSVFVSLRIYTVKNIISQKNSEIPKFFCFKILLFPL